MVYIKKQKRYKPNNPSKTNGSPNTIFTPNHIIRPYYKL